MKFNPGQKAFLGAAMIFAVVALNALVTMLLISATPRQSTGQIGGELNSPRRTEGLVSNPASVSEPAVGKSEGQAVRKFDNEYVSFSYLNGYHVYSGKVFDDPYGQFRMTIHVSSEPLSMVSPGEGGGAEITIYNYDSGEAYLAPYEDGSKTREESSLNINGQKVTQLLLTEKEDVPFGSPYEKVVFLPGQAGGYVVSYRYNEASQGNATGWMTILNSLTWK